MGIVGQAHEVAPQLLCPGEQHFGVLHPVGSSATVGLLLMDRDALQEDGLSIEQDLLAARVSMVRKPISSAVVALSTVIST